ncbi:MAG: elongation factor Ts [Candidatus Buchananbacteria bacterium RIFCSPLOWO2_01_FULL_46_12]|uniref:Elongation factor Ts n=2 Tax=Candidatus Buchananiibacteriota TaxID=1817903 RepID=A0A1G1YN90_9BACT|nr:MAG: elongation factor Ts [Candidatus Buchananbacteria bacterium RIFCSPHIGHO2_01_FULL_44_11]OGY53815.1 MAG: elongation factor Ts [Candidatus Buchananbacteria bacterium RIFCSPLOWO2_01_FULL_46_12]
MAIDVKTITQLRELTGAGFVDCQQALAESGGELSKATEILRKKGAIKAAKKTSERTAGEGLVESYIHSNGKVGVLIEVRCETDFVARNESFKALAHDLAMQVAGANPLYVKQEEVPAAVIAKEKEVYAEQLKNEGKPAAMWPKIIEGKIKKYYQENCLMQQSFIKDDSLTIASLVEQRIFQLGEKIEVTKFVRYQI